VSEVVTPIHERPSLETLLARGRVVVVEWRTWAVGAAFGVLIVLQRISVDATSGAAGWVAYAGVPAVCLTFTVGALRIDGHHVAAAALLVAVSPTVFTSVASGERHGALAAVMACLAALAVVWPRRAIAAWSAPVFVIGLVLWWGSGVSRGATPGPAWDEIIGSTGATVRSGLGVVGPAELPVPPATFLAWWCVVGMVVGAVVLGDRARSAIAVPLSVGVFVLVAWLITWQRGPVDAAGGMWLVAVAIAATGASTSSQAHEGVRLARLLIAASSTIWIAAFVRLHRSADASPALLVAVVVAVGAVAVVVWPGARESRRDAGE
jgi:hypothetical protein